MVLGNPPVQMALVITGHSESVQARRLPRRGLYPESRGVTPDCTIIAIGQGISRAIPMACPQVARVPKSIADSPISSRGTSRHPTGISRDRCEERIKRHCP
jgi:hypothetical protein